MTTDVPVELLDRVRGFGDPVVVLTGAGISAESGIPTFRGPEGYWTVGAREYHPMELATWEAFQAMPWQVWAWYLYRRGVCRRAEPNAAHHALARLATALGDRLTLVTQNVDGLHRRAGSPATRTYEIHGNIDRMRCAAECSIATWDVPDDIPAIERGTELATELRARLTCPRCGGPARPHVLWFDEAYDEERYALERTWAAARSARLLVIVGTSAQTNLPWQVVRIASQSDALLVDVNTEANPFAQIAATHGYAVRAPATIAVPALVDAILAE